MSAIAGILRFSEEPLSRGAIERMTAAMKARGPDGSGHWVQGRAGLGQCMLRTTPESVQETQPRLSEDEGLVIVLDGRVDNRETLQQQISHSGLPLRDRTDAELVLKAYQLWGEGCPHRLVGEFVFFIWDARRQHLFAARDVAGVRHLYFHKAEDWFGFASEIKGLLALQRIDLKLNESRLLDYLVPMFDCDEQIGTFYRNIYRLPAGHALRVQASGRIETWRYWDPSALPMSRFKTLEECAEAFGEQLQAAVKCRLRNHGPVAATLSGGLDSSTIVSSISKNFSGLLGNELQTISLIRQDREACLDWPHIRDVLEGEGLHPTIIASNVSSDICREFLSGAVAADEPFQFLRGFTYFLVARAAHANGCRILFEGMAGDLLFYGFEGSLDAAFRTNLYSWLPALLGSQLRHGGGRAHAAASLARAFLVSLIPELARSAYRSIRDERAMYNNMDIRFLSQAAAQRLLAEKRDKSRAVRHQLGSDQSRHAQVFTSGVLSFPHEILGELALAYEVEPRSPFSDRRVIEFAIRMPIEAKLYAPWYKHLLRQSMKGILHESVRWRRSIAGHPGWAFSSRLYRETIEVWPPTKEGLANLEKWLDFKALEKLRLDAQSDYRSLQRWYRLQALSRWLDHKGLS